MNLVSWSFPTQVVFGEGAVKNVADYARVAHARGNVAGEVRALLVCDEGVVRVGIAERVKTLLSEAGISTATYSGVDPNPVEENIENGVRALRAHKASVLVAVGGGSPLDAAKVIALRLHHERPLAEYDDAIGGDKHITGNVPPLVAIPTTAGTGSEVGRSGVVTLKSNGRKTVLFSPHLLAKVAILDPELTRDLPPHLTAATGFDALTHCIEAYSARGDHPMADGIALMGIRLCAKHLRRAVEAGHDMAARGGMMKAAMMGAVAFQKGLGTCHSMAHPLSSEKGLHHGLANAVCLPAVLQYNEVEIPEKLEEIRALLGNGKTCREAVSAFRAALGLPPGLRSQGVTEADLPKLADKAFEDACHGSNPRATSRDDFLKLFQESL